MYNKWIKCLCEVIYNAKNIYFFIFFFYTQYIMLNYNNINNTDRCEKKWLDDEQFTAK